MTYQNAKRNIIDIGEFLFANGYIIATDGNISLRLNSKEILITKTGVCKGKLGTRDIVKLEIENWKLKIGNSFIAPSTEYKMHLEIYKNRHDVNAVIHAHPLFVTTFAVTGKKLDVKMLTETKETLGQIGYVGPFKPGSLELAKAVGKTSIKHNVIILARHGVVVCGKDLTEAKYRLERLEFLAKVTLLASL